MKSQSDTAKLHPLLVRAVAQALFAIFKENRHADKVIENALRLNPKAGSRDRAFIAETTYEIVRYYRLYTEILGKIPQAEADFWLLCGVHFLVRGDTSGRLADLVPRINLLSGSTPRFSPAPDPFAKPATAGSETEVRDAPKPAAAVLPNWLEFKSLNIPFILQKAEQVRAVRKFRESIPDWLDELGAAELGEEWDETLTWLNRPASVVLRANRLRADRNALRQALKAEGIETELVGEDEDALVLTRRQNIFQTKAFHDGWFEMQDYSSQQVAPLLAPWPGQRVVDACAGGGGKSLHLAAIMQNRGSLIALDTVAWKLEELRNRARRAGIANIETRLIENRKTIKRLHDSADRLLLDVPCTGLGVLRRNPDAKWKINQDSLDNLRAVQQEILQDYSPILKAGGRMVYATCSILPSENQEQVRTFLQSEAGQDFTLLQEKRILPQDHGFDGFYMALLQRKRAEGGIETEQMSSFT